MKIWDWKDGKIADIAEEQLSSIFSWQADTLTLNQPGSGLFGYVYQGPTQITHADWKVTLSSGMYFLFPDQIEISGGSGLLVQHSDYSPFPTVGGPIEQKGRLKYIDGCTDSLLLPPVRKGDPCLNLLHFPAAVEQTPHTHPSCRIGMVMSGMGECDSWDDEGTKHSLKLKPGILFSIAAGRKHRFRSPDNSELRVLAYHPDSDFGPQDENHPMVNRTLIDGVSASNLCK